MTHKVFVYGTLRPGTSPTRLVPGTIYDLGWFPGLILGGDGPGVAVEVVAVDDSGLAQLDSYEGYSPDYPEDSLYLRQKVSVDGPDGPEEGFIYTYNQPVGDRPVVSCGDWLKYKNQPKGVSAERLL